MTATQQTLEGPPAEPLPPGADLTDLLAGAAVRSPDLVQARRRIDGRWVDVSCRELHLEVCALARGLVAAGVAPGDRVGLWSRTRYEWTVADLAIWYAGAVSVPLYDTASAEQAEWVLGDSGAVACIVEDAERATTLAELRGRLPALREVWAFDGGGLDALVAAGADLDNSADTGDTADTGPDVLAERRAALGPASLATLVYTSGTTGRPKGCRLTHGNLRSGVENSLAGLGSLVEQGSSTLLFLPLAHIFAREIQLGCLARGVVLGHVPDTSTLADDLATFRPTFVLAVPRVFEKVHDAAQATATDRGKAKVFARAESVAIRYSRALDGSGPGPVLRLQHALYDVFVFARLRSALGGRARWAVSGGAALGDRLGHFFRGVGVTVLEGYGLTETCAASTVNRPDAQRMGTVGLPIAGSAVRVDETGEILLRGPHVFDGYWQDEEATRAVLDTDGWFRTGDLGHLDPDGFLSITGRRKEIIVTAAGKNVAPAPLEDRVRAHPLVSQCVVVGDGRAYVAALVTLDEEALPGWLHAHRRDRSTPAADLVEDPAVLADLQSAVDAANRSVSTAESIRRFRVLAVDLSEAAGYLTPTLKVRRDLVLSAHASDVEALYA